MDVVNGKGVVQVSLLVLACTHGRAPVVVGGVDSTGLSTSLSSYFTFCLSTDTPALAAALAGAGEAAGAGLGVEAPGSCFLQWRPKQHRHQCFRCCRCRSPP